MTDPNEVVVQFLSGCFENKLIRARKAMPDIVARLICEAVRHRESLRIIRMEMTKADIDKWLPGLDRVELDNAAILCALGERL